ncbi:peptide ligase PGM1-related protein [Burkholderia ubonensis]|nr:peptide ligase PGM1-related protein [Burkholderia ubonensis]MDY7791278.1 peptide ligase PGM1-related protein [Burkholderia ubonensis]
MAKLIVGNVDNEAMIGDTSRASLPLRQVSAIAARRLVWQMEADDVAILPSPVSPGMMAYVSEVTGRRLSVGQVISPSRDAADPLVLTSDRLLDESMLAALRARHVGQGSWTVYPYYYTSSVGLLCERLGIAQPVSNGSNFMAQAGAELLNRKAVFRALASGRVGCADGRVCRSFGEFHLTLRDLLARHASVIVKQDVNAGGDGNIAVTLERRASYPGVRKVYALANISDVDTVFSRDLWALQTDTAGNCQVIVECFHESSDVLYSEYEIGADAVRLTSYGDLRMDASGDKRGNGMIMWTGFQIPSRLRPDVVDEFVTQSGVLAEISQRLGFVGRANFDAIVTRDAKVVFTEINGRIGGCSHLDGILRTLVGPDYLATHAVVTRNRVPVRDLDRALASSRQLTDLRAGAGVVVLTEDLSGTGTIEYMVFATHPDDALALEREFQRELVAAGDAVALPG